MTKPGSFFTTIGAASLLLICTASSSFAGPNDPVITNATIAANAITITGTNLRGADGLGPWSATFGSIALAIQSATTTTIVANFPASSPASGLAPGEYLLTVFFQAGATATFTVQVGSGTTTTTTITFPFVTNQAGLDTGIAITNLQPGTSGSCTLNWLGTPANPATTTIGPINGTNSAVYTFLVSVTVPNFQGYLVAHCPFRAQAMAFVSDLGLRNVAFSVPAIVSNP